LVKGHWCSAEVIKEKGLDLLNEPVVKSLSEKYKKTSGQIVLNWHIKMGVIPIPGTSKPERMKENLEANDFKMDENDIKSLCSSFNDKQFRFCDSFGIYGIDIFA